MVRAVRTLPSLVLLIALLVPTTAWGASRSDRIEATYGIGNIENGTASWTDRELKIVEASLRILDEAELRGVQGVKLVRMKRSPRIAGTGLYLVDGEGPRILIYDRAFKGPGKGSPKVPNQTLVHEFGHAIAHKTVRAATRRAERAVDEANALVDKYNAAVGRYNALARRWNQTRDRAVKDEMVPVGRRIRRLEGDIVEIRREVRKLNRKARELHSDHNSPFPRSGVLRDYKVALGLRFGPTPYGRRNLQESFAESFMLHKTDRKTLKKRLPKVAKWLQADGHLNPTR